MNNIAIINLAAVADALYGTPLIRHIRKLHPYDHLTWFIRDSFRDIAITNPDIDSIVCVELPNEFGNRQKDEPRMFKAALEHARNGRYDKVYNLQYFPYFSNFYENPYESFLDLRIRNAGLNPLDIKDRKIVLNITDNDRRSIDRKFPNLDWSKVITFNHLSYAASPIYNLEQYQTIADLLKSKGFQPMFTGSSTESIPIGVLDARGTSYREWTECINRSKLFCGLDSGAKALAASTDTFMLILHSPDFPVQKTSCRAMGIRTNKILELTHPFPMPQSLAEVILKNL